MKELSQQIANLSPEQRALFEKRLQQKGLKRPQLQTIPRRQESDALPLSFAQQRLWFIQQLDPDNNSYNVPSALRLKGWLKIDRLEQTLNEIVKRHETLRTTFATTAEKQPIQLVTPFQPFPLPVVDLREIPHPELEVQRLAMEEFQCPFDLTKPLLRLRLLKLGATDHVLLMTAHHIICDRWSIGVFLREMTLLYQAFSQGQTSPLTELPIQYADWAIWQRQRLESVGAGFQTRPDGSRESNLEVQLAYWREQLKDVSILELPTDRLRPTIPTYQGAQYPLGLSKALSDALKALSAKEGVTLFALLLAAFKVLLYRYTAQDDIVIGTEMANRDRRETEGLIGLLVNTLVLRTDLSGNPTFRELLSRVREVTLGAYAHQDLPFEKLVEVLNPERNLSQMIPLFQVKFDLQLAPVKPLELSGLILERLPKGNGTVKYELRFNLQDTEQGLRGQVEYSTDLFDEATIARMVEHWQILLEGIVANPENHLSELPLLSETEQQKLLLEWNETQRDYPTKLCIHQLFEAQVEKTPNNVALVFEDQKLTYRELNQLANQLAHYLQKLGVNPEVKVGVCVERSLEMVIGLLGILKAGGAYVPLDPTYPQERLNFILKDSQVSVLLTGGRRQEAGGRRQNVIYLDADWGIIAQESEENLKSLVNPDNLAYVIYTSGSTGSPKGVAIEHRSTVQLLHWAKDIFSRESMAGVLASTSICFDLSVFELFVPLSWGGKVILAENALALPTLGAANEVTLINTVPSAIAQLLQINGIPSSVRTVNLAGEALQNRLVQQLEQREHIEQIFNLYGPSEDTTYSTYALVKNSSQGSIPIGKAIANTQVYILDRYLQPVPMGVWGELYIGGAGLARGYLNRSDLTAEKFIPNPFVRKEQGTGSRGAEGQRGRGAEEQRRQGSRVQPATCNLQLYKTGDLVRYHRDGNLEFLGRLDHQVKIRGYRIEIGEIEAVLSQYPAIRENVVIVRKDEPDNKRLVAYIVPNHSSPSPHTSHTPHTPHTSPSHLRLFLEEKLPSYMIPATFVELEALPRLPNGKLDRKSLPAPDTLRPGLETAYVAAQTELEQTIASIWQKELNVEKVGIYDNFFELGGHSLLGIKIIAEISEVLGVQIPLRSLFQKPTVAGLIEQIEAVDKTEKKQQTLPQIVPNLKERYQLFPLTDIQQAYLIGRSEAFELGNVATHGYREIETVGLALKQVEQALRRLIERHDMLRVIVQADGHQQILPTVPPYEIQVVDLRGKNSEQVETRLAEIRDRLSHQILPTDQWPLFEIQAALLDYGIRFHVSFDVLMGDAWSFQLLGWELAQLVQNPEKSLSPLTLSFRDYVLAEIAFRESELYRHSLAYWQNHLLTLPSSPELPLEKNLAAIQNPRFVRRTHRLEPESWQHLKQKATQVGITPSGLLLAAFAEILVIWSKSPQFTLNLTLFNRLPLHPEVNRIIGDFTSSILLGVDNSGQDSFSVRARRIQAQLGDDLDHRHVSGVKVLRELARLQGRTLGALMPVVFTSTLTQNSQNQRSSRDWQTEVVYSVSQTAQVYLDHQVSEIAGALVFNWDAIEELFPTGVLDDMFSAYCNFLERLANEEELWQVKTRQLLPAAQVEQIAAINHTETDLGSKDALLHTLFFDQVPLQSQKAAIVTSNRTLTYQELSDRALTLTYQLQKLGVRPHQRVAIVMEKGWEQVVAVLGILASGAAYVPIDPELPTERRLYLLQETETQQVITQSWLDTSLEWPENITRICIDTLKSRGGFGNPPLPSPHTSLAYVIYTSGSTGLPKGVMIDHQGAVNTILDINQRFNVTAQDRILALSSLSFDLSVYDIFGTLAAGGTLIIPNAEATKDPAHWAELLAQHEVTIWNSVPALMQMLVEHLHSEQISPHSLRLVMLSGDWLPLCLGDRIRTVFGDPQVVSLGGATEASIWSILYPITTVDPTWKSIPYGRPMANQHFYVLNEALEPCPIWVTGQLYIGGIGLAKGYWRNDEKTNDSFIIHPRTQERLYKTGDLGRYLPDGTIEFLGREDFQVKVNGYRIELGEIETTLKQHPAIAEAVVSTIGESRENKQLVAYIVPHREVVANLQDLSDQKLAEAFDPNQLNGQPELSPAAALSKLKDVLSDPVERIEFKLKQPGLKQLESSQSSIQLPQPEWDEALTQAYLRRQSYRQFLEEPISLEQFSRFISCLVQMKWEGSPLPKYRYASAGSLYPVQTYLYVKPNCVEGLETGIYYYHPAEHRLVLLSANPEIESNVYGVNQPIFEQSAFSLFLMGQLNAITPLYGEKARDFCLLEAGYISQLLMESAPEQEIGLCPIGALEFHRLRDLFVLEPSQILLHSFVGGRIDLAWIKQWLQPTTVQKSESMTDKLRQFLHQKLPEYMIPSSYMLLETLPLTSNGKVDRKALPKPDSLRLSAQAEYVAPRTEWEKAIAAIWQKALKLEKVGIHDNFFDLGGNSLSATQAIAQMRQTLQVELSIRRFFETPTIADLALTVAQNQDQKERPHLDKIERIEREDTQQLLTNLDRISEQEMDALLEEMLEEG